MRIRSIHPEFYRSEDVAGMDWHTRLVFIGLWSYVDDNGVGRDVEKLIVADLYPLEEDPRETLARVSAALATLSDGGQITRYTVDRKPFLHITAWDKWQKIDKPGKQRYPAPTCDNADVRESVANAPREVRETPVPGEGEKGRRGEGEKGAARRRPSTSLPASWAPNDKHKEQAHAKGVDVGDQADRFRNWAEAKDQRYVDWDAAFRNWLKNARPSPGAAPRPTSPPKDQLPW